jgi:DnaD/phage-associated family protein
MARPRKQSVDYFPHDTDAAAGKTLTILQSKYGNDGYAFWFKLLELLGRTAGHYYAYQSVEDLEFLCAKTHQKDTETVLNILGTLDVLGAIDHELYLDKIIWCQKFVNRVADAYSRAKAGPPVKPSINGVNVWETDQSADILHTETPENGTEMPQTKLKEKETKLHKRENPPVIPPGSSSLTKEDVLEVYKQNMGFDEQDTMPELLQADIEASCDSTSPEWVVEAIKEAVVHNKRTWPYVVGVLRHWTKYGKNGNKDPATDADKYVKGQFGHMVRR